MRLIFLSLLLVLGACAHKGDVVTCAKRDWYELGRRDGSQGAPVERLNSYKRDCGGEFDVSWETVYLNGRNAGLVEYCLPENAYELGRMGLNYSYVCPSTMEPDFLAAYRKGQQARMLQLKKKELDAKIESLTDELLQTHVDSPESKEITEQLDRLKQLRAVNERELTRVSK